MVTSYFADIETIISQNLNSADSRIYIAVAWFTNQRLFDCIIRALQRKIEVKILILDDILNRNEFGLDYGIIVNNGGQVNFSKMDGNTMHNKFCIVDNKVITGSYNWTYHANLNSENIVIIDDPDITNNYSQQFEKLFNAGEPIKLPYEHLKWTDVKEGDFLELRRNIFRDVVAKNDHNREVRKAKLIELNNAYKSENQQSIIDASSLPSEEKVTTLFDVLTTEPQNYEFDLWKSVTNKVEIENTGYYIIRKWIFKPNEFINTTVKGVFTPYGEDIYDDDAEIDISINNKPFVDSLKKFIGANEINDETYKTLPEELICIENVNMFLCPFLKSMLKKNQSGNICSSEEYYGLWVLGIVSGGEWESCDIYDPSLYASAIINSEIVRAEWDSLSFIEGWNPFERGKKIKEKYFSL